MIPLVWNYNYVNPLSAHRHATIQIKEMVRKDSEPIIINLQIKLNEQLYHKTS